MVLEKVVKGNIVKLRARHYETIKRAYDGLITNCNVRGKELIAQLKVVCHIYKLNGAYSRFQGSRSQGPS